MPFCRVRRRLCRPSRRMLGLATVSVGDRSVALSFAFDVAQMGMSNLVLNKPGAIIFSSVERPISHCAPLVPACPYRRGRRSAPLPAPGALSARRSEGAGAHEGANLGVRLDLVEAVALLHLGREAGDVLDRSRLAL